jgi:hypothetical protein
MLSKVIDSDSWGTYSQMATVTGDLNDAGLFVGSKTINIIDTGSYPGDNGSSSWQAQSTFVQTSSSIAIDGAETGTWNGTDNGMAATASHSIRLVANADLEDSNVEGQDYMLTNLAIGHGAARARMDGTYTRDTTASQCESWQTDAGTNSDTGLLRCSDSWGFDLTEGWNADDMSIDNNSTSGVAASHISVVQAETLPDALGSVSLNFDTGETYNCSDAIAATVTVDMDALGVACGQRLELDYNWVNCHDIMGDQHQDCEEGQCED